MIESSTNKRKFVTNHKSYNINQSNNSLSHQRLRDITQSQSSPAHNSYSHKHQNSKKIDGDIFRKNKVNSLLPLVNQANTATSTQIYNSSDFKYDEEDKHSNSQFQNNYEETFSASKNGFNHNINSFSKSQSETIKIQEKQIKHLKMMNEYYQITLKQKDQIYKTLVLENIKLKHQIQLLELQNNSKSLANPESHLLFKTQKVLLNDQLLKPFQNLTTLQTLQPKTSIENVNIPPPQLALDKSSSENQTENTENVVSYQRRSSKQKMTFVFKPPRLNDQQYSEVPYKIKDERISKSTTSKAISTEPVNNKQQEEEQEEVVPSKRNSSIQQKSIHSKEKNISISTPNNPGKLKYDTTTTLVNGKEQNSNFLSIKTKTKPSNLNENLSRKISDYPSLQVDDIETQSQQFNQSFLNETPQANSKQNIFDQFEDNGFVSISNFQPKKVEIKTSFVSHSTDFAFITQLLELKSKAQDNYKIYNENKSIQQMRQMLCDERNLKKTILNLSKNTFGAFYDCLLHTLESSDLFFHLTNKLKNMVNGIIKIHLSLEINEAFSKIVKETCNVLECDRASVFLVNPQAQELWTRIAKGTGVIKVPFGQGLVGFVANTMKPLNILDAHKDSRFNPEIDKKNNYLTKSVLCVPVIDPEKGNLVGVMQAINKNDGFFTKDDEGCLNIMAYHATNVLRNSISHDEKQKNQSMIKNLLNLSIKISKCLNVEELVNKSRNMITSYLDIGELKIFLIDKEKQKIFTISEQNQREDYEMDCGLIGHSIKSKQDLMIDNAYNHMNFNQLVDINTSMPLSMYLIWDNQRKKNQVYGVVQVINQNGIHNIGQTIKSQVKFDTHLKLFCEILGSQVKKFYKQKSSYQSQVNSPLKTKSNIKKQLFENNQDNQEQKQLNLEPK